MITIDQLLESVDLDFEPRYITKDSNGVVHIWNTTKLRKDMSNGHYPPRWNFTGSAVAATFTHLKLAEFESKDWTECIYEVPRKTIGKIEKINKEKFSFVYSRKEKNDIESALIQILDKQSELVDAVNELKAKEQC